MSYAYNIRRSTLDPLIRSRAAETPGVDLLLGHQVTGLVREAGRTLGVRASTAQGEREIRARLVVGADGKDSAVAKFAEVPARQYENARFGYLAHFRNLPLHGGISHAWFLEPDMAYAFPNDDGVTVVAVLPDKKRLPAFREATRVRRSTRWPAAVAADFATSLVGAGNAVGFRGAGAEPEPSS
ncbi:FAD-dependent monooxygenase [Streptomyces sp. NPDC048258]|uniref:FAD-dependent monooxygenase n=1 Tax=Streptomyces sp. NPDC048258 TaxID=3365527 RepID=UPI003722CAEB